ncbi:hypothetical protein ACTG9Q_22390 [Actinokineospora sp. 24-640]
MPERKRLLAGVAGAALLVAAILVLRTPSDDAPATEMMPPSPERVMRYSADSVVIPAPGRAPDPPRAVRVTPGPTWQTVAWTGSAPGYEVRWPGGTRLVTEPEVQLDGVAAGTPISVRSVDAFGQHSAAAEVTGASGPGDSSWRSGLTGFTDDFASDGSVRSDLPGSRWHLSGYRGCVDIGERSRGAGLSIELGCGSDVAMLRARSPLRLVGGAGRVAVLTDAAGPGGALTVDLVPGPADRVGAEVTEGAVRAVLDDGGPRVLPGGSAGLVVPRGAGVLHLVEVEVGPSGVVLRQDGRVVASSSSVPAWDEAYVVVGVRGPSGRRARVRLAGAGFTGPAVAVPSVVEVPITVATRRVLGPDEEAPRLGIARRPLATATAARVVATVSVPAGMAPSGMTVQLGPDRVPARPATAVSAGPGAVVTVIADVPARLLGPTGPHSLSPLAVRAPGAGPGAMVLESYLEIEPGAGATFPTEPRRAFFPVVDALPATTVTLGDSAGKPLAGATAAPQGRLVLDVRLDGRAAQWDTGTLAGVIGFEVRLDGRLVAAVPTAVDGPSPGGDYAVALALGGLAQGGHVLETRVLGPGVSSSTMSRFRIR